MHLKCFQADLMNLSIGLCLPYGLAQKGNLLAVALIEIGFQIATQCQDQTRNAGSRAQVGDSFSVLATYPGGDLVGMFDRVVAPGFTVASVYDAGGLTVTLTGVQAVPEPGTWALWLAGAALVGARARRRRQPA